MRKSFLYLFILTIAALFYSCDSTDPKPPDTKPPGYQEDIPWPSLADSPWPMEGTDPQNTFRSRKPIQLNSDSIFESDVVWTESAITVGEDSTIYFPVNPTGECQLVAMGFNGEIKWASDIGSECYHPPLVLSDGSLVLLSSKAVIKFNSTGVELWRYVLAENADDTEINITKTGDILFTIAGNKIIALSQRGTLKWEFNSTQQEFWKNELVLSPDSKTAYLIGNGLTSFNIVDQLINWTVKVDTLTEAVTVLSDGSIIMLCSSQQESAIVKLSNLGSQIWEYKFQYTGCDKLSVDRYGNIYYSANDLTSINQDGKLNWSIKDVNNTDPPICSYENNIHTVKNFNDSFSFITMDYTGNIVKSINHQYDNYSLANPAAIVYNGFIFSGWGLSKVFIIK